MSKIEKKMNKKNTTNKTQAKSNIQIQSNKTNSNDCNCNNLDYNNK